MGPTLFVKVLKSKFPEIVTLIGLGSGAQKHLVCRPWEFRFLLGKCRLINWSGLQSLPSLCQSKDMEAPGRNFKWCFSTPPSHLCPMPFTSKVYFSTSLTRVKKDTVNASERQLITPSSFISTHLTLVPWSSASWVGGNVKGGLDLLRPRGAG